MNEQTTIPTYSGNTGQPHQNGAGNGIHKTADATPHAPTDKEDGTGSTFTGLCRLPYMEEDEDYTRPTAYAFESALTLLLSARDSLHQSAHGFPRATFGTTDEGTILVYWRKPGRSVQAVVPSQPKGDGYILVLEGSAPTIYDDLDGPTLAKTLEEFNG